MIKSDIKRDVSSQAMMQELLKRYAGDTKRLMSDMDSLAKRQAERTKQAKKPIVDTPVVVSISNLDKTYKLKPNNVEVLKGVSLDIHQGEFVALTGPSGSGKSTLLQLIGGLDTPTNGRIEINGTDLSKLNDSKLSSFRNKTIGFVFQFFYLQPFLSVQTNTDIPAMFCNTPRSERRQRSDELLAQVGLDDRAKHLPKELSGGQMQRAAIARALINKPKLILADEPTGNLDSKNGDAIMELFEQARKNFGTTIIMVTHDPHVASYADREIQLADGKII